MMQFKVEDKFRKIILILSYSWLLVLVLLPLIFVFGISLSYESFEKLPYKFFIIIDEYRNWKIDPNLGNYLDVLTSKIYFNGFMTSFRLAFCATLLCLIIGYPIAFTISRVNVKYRAIWILLMIVPFWTSLLIRIYAWIIILRNNGILNNILLNLGFIDQPIEMLNSEFAVIVGFVYTYLPFMVLPIYSALAKIDHEIHEAAEDLGCKPISVFWKITVPMSLSGVMAGCVLVFIPLLGEYVVPDLLGGINVITIGKVLWGEFFFCRDWLIAAAIAIILAIIILLPYRFINKFLNRDCYEA